MLEINCIIRGDVQGVGFRATARSLAQQMRIVGFAKNLPDGTVELCVQGTKDQLEGYLISLKNKFKNTDWKDNWSESHQPFNNFSIF